jgi:predicted transcriptional regulator
MNIETVLAALDSGFRRDIIKILAKEPRSVAEVMKELTALGRVVNYRECVYRGLEKLVDAGFVEKYYDKQKGIAYKLVVRRIQINLAEGTLET